MVVRGNDEDDGARVTEEASEREQRDRGGAGDDGSSWRVELRTGKKYGGDGVDMVMVRLVILKLSSSRGRRSSSSESGRERDQKPRLVISRKPAALPKEFRG
ncbi:hypothetical protein CDL15_Pgr015114 [Punica granatum]|uniref:Uncharacterized protein n=1 Tax=Punica granatum TaxID=22663 RepID=A0A218WVM7_PUNGR|nr:hypothetical protein CDL15_Pgr015114 [Punica granatum]